MRVERLRIRAFGRLRAFDSGPEPLGALVVVLGPNEAGKSTLFHFLTTVLYGFHPATREAFPYAPWDGREADGSALLTLGDGTRCEVHRRLGTGPGGTLEHAGRSEDLRNRPLPAAERVPLTIFRQCFALTLAELGALGGESWARIEERLVAGLGTTDLRSPRTVAEELENEAGTLWRPHRRGNQAVRQMRERRRELEGLRRDVAQSDQTVRGLVRDLERVRVELAEARATREADEVYVERYGALRPIRAALARAHALEAEAGPRDDLAELPADPAARLAELEARVREQQERLDEVTREADAPRRRAEAHVEGDAELLGARSSIERLVARVQAAAWMRARAGQLEIEARELDARAEAEAAELFDAPLARLDAERLRTLPAAELRLRAAELEEARARGAVEREALRRAAQERAGDGRADPRALAAAAAIALVGAGLVAYGVLRGRPDAAIGGAAAMVAGAVLVAVVLRPKRAPERPVDPGVAAREAAARAALLDPLAGLPVRTSLVDRSPAQLATGIERLQGALRARGDRTEELAKLRGESDALAEEIGGLAWSCGVEVPDDAAAAAHVLGGHLAEAARRHAAAERAREEATRIESAREREAAALDRARAAVAELERRLAALGDGDPDQGLRRFRARTRAAAEAARIVADLERAHPDLEAIRERIARAEASGEEWVVDEEAIARRTVRRPELAAQVEALAAREAALTADVEHLAGGDTLDRVDGELEALDERLLRLERERDRKHVLARLVREAERRFREQHQPDLVRRASEYLGAITAGRWERLVLSDGEGDFELKLREAGSPHPIPIAPPISTGTREQVYLALRLAAIDQLDQDDERLPIFLDEALVNWDPARRERGLDLLARIAERRQAFVFTAQPEAARALAARGARVLELDGPG